MQGVYESIAEDPGVADREAHWVIPLVRRGGVRISRLAAPCVILHAAADKQRLLVREVEIHLRIVRVEMNRSRRIEPEATRVEAVSNRAVVDVVFPRSCGQG